MFALFYNLYLAMFIGAWANYNINEIKTMVQGPIGKVCQLVTNVFSTSGVDISQLSFAPMDLIYLASITLTLITSIGIVIMAVKGIKRIFSIFFYGVR